MKTQVKDSELYQTIADMAKFLEAGASKEDYGFLDSGTTLEISTALLAFLRSCVDWQALETRYETVGGHIYSPDDESWEILHNDTQDTILDYSASLLGD